MNRQIRRWMRIAAACSAIFLARQGGARADVSYSESNDKTTVIRLSVTPAAEPVPALKYRFVARDIDLLPGNAVPYYQRAIAEISHVEPRVLKKYGSDLLDSWESTGVDAPTLAELPLNNVGEASRSFDSLVRDYLQSASLRRNCDWELGLDQIRGPAIVSFLLPECQQLRAIARTLVLRIRFALAEGRYDDAIDMMRINFRLAGDTAQIPFFVCGLVGLAEANMTNGTVLELIASPQSPNLYWALAELPDPLVDIRPAARFELEFGPRMFPLIDRAESTERSPEEWNRLYSQTLQDLNTLGNVNLPASGDLGAGLGATGAALLGYSHAKAQLIAEGLNRQRVEQMPVGQVMAIYSGRVYQQFADEYTKLWNMPYWEMVRREAAVEHTLHAAGSIDGGTNREVLPIASLLMPAVQAVMNAQIRTERELAAMQVIEALRMYAASHSGAWPERLDEVAEVPVPVNPATGQPFVYRLEGSTAVLELPASDHVKNDVRRFEITIAKP